MNVVEECALGVWNNRKFDDWPDEWWSSSSKLNEELETHFFKSVEENIKWLSSQPKNIIDRGLFILSLMAIYSNDVTLENFLSFKNEIDSKWILKADKNSLIDSEVLNGIHGFIAKEAAYFFRKENGIAYEFIVSNIIADALKYGDATILDQVIRDCAELTADRYWQQRYRFREDGGAYLLFLRALLGSNDNNKNKVKFLKRKPLLYLFEDGTKSELFYFQCPLRNSFSTILIQTMLENPENQLTFVLKEAKKKLKVAKK